ncbi:M3 family metallopeptidase [Henriciella sp.]|uniref:M3 family metallopeptidase n=1 Tax=Henriciella sp. TaxID=1968823 RepID=UPI00260C6D5E|nr:M3 family metallopeptidase [Henriciella sp.]
MKSTLFIGASALALTAVAACTTTQDSLDSGEAQIAAGQSAADTSDDNEMAEMKADADWKILLADWDGPYGGVPPFDKVEVSMFQPALEAAIETAQEGIDETVSQTAEPTFENTILPLEEGAGEIMRVSTVYGIWASNLSGPEVQAVQREVAPKLAAFQDSLYQNADLFARIDAIYNGEDFDALTPEQQRLVWDYYTDFTRAGAGLDEADKSRVAEINQELASLYTTFSNNLLHDEEAYVTWLTEEELSGLPQSVISAAKSAAGSRDNEGGDYAILNTRSSMDPFLTYSDNRALREEVWRTYYNRGDNGDAYDNNQVIADIMKLRAERSALLGYDNYAAWSIEKAVAKTPDAAMDLMMKVWPAAKAKVDSEVAAMQEIADAEGADITIAPWDYRYYAEKVRQAEYDFDSEEVKQYLQLENLREGMFWMAGELYGFEFQPVDNVPVFHEDVRVWEVLRDGEHVGLWYFDPYARSGKRSGAWMNAYRTQDNINGYTTPIVSNNSNFVEGAEGEPILISWDDASTLFHEFGHALHGLNSNVTYPSLSGTAVPRDYVEFPSQVHENWLPTPEVLQRYALHVETGEPIPQELVDKIERAANARQGFDTTEYLASALVDMKLHTMTDFTGFDADTFERETLDSLGMPEELPMRHRMPQFAHVFSGEGYAAGYYAYLWADTFSADAWEAFEEAGGPYDKETAAKFQKWILSVGNTIDPSEAYKEFRGHAPDTNALMRDRGFGVPGEASGATDMDVGAGAETPGE